MSNIIDSIQVSGITYDLVGGGGITSGEVQTMIDESVSGKVDTSTYTAYTAATDTALAGKQTTLTAGTGIDITDNVISATGGGGKAIEAGRGISITTGETADTVSFNLPISAGTGANSIIEGDSTSAMSRADHAEGRYTYANGGSYPAHAEGYQTSATSYYCHSEGRGTKATSEGCHAEGKSTEASGDISHAEGQNTKALANFSHAEGYYTTASSVTNVSGIQVFQGHQSRHAEGCYTLANNSSTHTEGYNTQANNFGEHASGVFNVSSTASTTYGDSGNTLFSVGNGTADNARHNAFEIRQNGDIYIVSGGTDIKLQDNLGGGGGNPTVELTQDEYDALVTAGTVSADTYYIITDAAAVDLSNYYTTAQTDTKISQSVSGKADTTAVTQSLSSKQDTLVSGTNIKTINNQSLLGSGNITIQGGGGTGSCVVNDTTIYDKYYGSFNGRAPYVVIDYTGDKSTASWNYYYVSIADDNYNYYVNQAVICDYTTSSYTLTNYDEEQYISVTYDSTIEDFIFSPSSSIQSIAHVTSLSGVDGYVKVPFYEIQSDTSCAVIENDIPQIISKTRDDVLRSVNNVFPNATTNEIIIYSTLNNGSQLGMSIGLGDIDGSNGTLNTNIQIPLGVSGWTNVVDSEQGGCQIGSFTALKFRVTFNYDPQNVNYGELQINYDIMISQEGYSTQTNDTILFDYETGIPYLQSNYFQTAATLTWSASTQELVVEYPASTYIEDLGGTFNLTLINIGSNYCHIGSNDLVKKIEKYGEIEQPLKPYVQETRAALGGLKLVKLTQSEYNALSPNYDANTLYVIVN